MDELIIVKEQLKELEHVLDSCPCDDPAYDYFCAEYSYLIKRVRDLEHADERRR